jgi:feruloyl esterase
VRPWFIPPVLFVVLGIIPPAPAAQSCESLAGLKVPNMIITAAMTVAAGPFTTPGSPPEGRSPRAIALPAFCRVQATVEPTISLEVWLPTADWNGSFEAVGNGGFAGSISYSAMIAALKSGYAVASTDTGHTGGPGRVDWALGHPELVLDFGYRAVHEMTLKAKTIIESFYGAGPRFSYFNGCSNGGRQGLTEAQRYPEDYNGILAGAPANNWTHFEIGSMLWFTLATVKDAESYIPTDKLAAIDDASLAACDAVDGLKDGLIDDPRKCRFDPAVLRCKDGDSAGCLTAKQVEALRNVYAGPPSLNGKQIYPPILPGGERGWASFMTDPAPFKSMSYSAAVDFFKYMVYENPNWSFRSWDFAKGTPNTEAKLSATLDAVDPNLKSFRDRGGRLLIYQGWSDPVVSPLNTIQYYLDVITFMRKQEGVVKSENHRLSSDQVTGETGIRLFMIPGMNHCGGGPGPTKFDAFGPLVNWIEHKEAPQEITGSHLTNDVVDRTRPLCPYPMVAQYTGQGSINDAVNFGCQLPRNR